MNYPACPENRSDCRFARTGRTCTLMWSPIQYDREGRPVAGGGNRVTEGIECMQCGKQWYSAQTELEDAQGVERKWEQTISRSLQA